MKRFCLLFTGLMGVMLAAGLLAAASGAQPPSLSPSSDLPADSPAYFAAFAAEDPVSSLAELRKKYPETFIIQGPSQAKNVALTFDDVPDTRYTPKVLDILKQHRIRATFFVVGYRAVQHPDLVQRMVREGHVIGNHSFNHAYFPKLSLAAYAGQILKTQAILNRIAGYRPRVMRPPYGAINEEQLLWARKNGFIVVNWNVDSLDWKNLKAKEVEANVLSHVRPGSIILQHAGGGKGEDLTGTIQALPKIIRHLREKGYHFVTVPELVGVPVNN